MSSDADSDSDDDFQRTVCFCHCVSYAALVEAIRGGCRSLAEVQARTKASTGCGGCEGEVQQILEQEMQKLASASGEKAGR